MSIRLTLVLCLIIICLIWQIKAKCLLETDESTAPLFVRNFGLKKIILKKYLNIELEDGESIDSYCTNGFQLRPTQCCYQKVIEHRNHAMWTCEDGKITSSFPTHIPEYFTVGCLPPTPLGMFESFPSLTDCVDTTLVLGKKLDTDKNNIKLAALCFDPEKQKLKFLSFIAHTKTNVLSDENSGPNELDYLRLDKHVLDFHYLFEFMSTSDFNTISDTLNQKHNMYDSDLFVFDSLMQYNTDLSSYGDVLNIVWSKRLKTGSWRKFMDALYVESMDVKYQVRLGTAGLIELEVTGNCNITQPLIYQKNDILVKTPKYIWAHLKMLQPLIPKPKESNIERVPEEFVVIGINSPLLSLEELTKEQSLCPDICEKIPWLSAHRFNKMRLMPLHGITICCRVEDILKKLDNFPYTLGKTFNFTPIYGSLNTEVNTTSIPESYSWSVVNYDEM